MDVDQGQGTSTAITPLPHIDENEILEHKNPKENMLEMLDNIEAHVERFRKEATHLEEEKDKIMSSLDSIFHADSVKTLEDNDREDIIRYADRLLSRLQSVDVHVHTQRDQMQEESLFQINHFIDSLVVSLRSDPFGTKMRCQSYMSACSSHYMDAIADKTFESALLGCTLDDQKRIKKRLQGLLHYISKLEMEMNNMI